MNPKDQIGQGTKAPMFSNLALPVLGEVSVVALSGARKYGRHNWRRDQVFASTYVDAAMRHMVDWWEGLNNDAESGVSHLSHAICSLMILRDAEMRRQMIDDRPPATFGTVSQANRHAARVIEKLSDPKPPILRGEGPDVDVFDPELDRFD